MNRQLFAWNRSLPPAFRTHRARRSDLHGVGRIGEIDGTVRLHDDVVRAVEPLPLEPLGQDRAIAAVRNTNHTPTAMLGCHDVGLAIQRQAVGPPRNVCRQLRSFWQAAPTYDTVIRNIAKVEGVPTPHGPFGKDEPASDTLYRGIGGNEIVQPFVSQIER